MDEEVTFIDALPAILGGTLTIMLWILPIIWGVKWARRKGISPHWMWFGVHPLGAWIAFAVIRWAVRRQRCRACGHTIRSGSAYCPGCGHPIGVPVDDKISTWTDQSGPALVAGSMRGVPTQMAASSGDVSKISGLWSLGMYEVGLVATQSELLLVRGRQKPAALIWLVVFFCTMPLVVLLSLFSGLAFCLTPLLVLLIISVAIGQVIDQIVRKPKRDRAWSDFLSNDLSSLRTNRSACKTFPITRLSSIRFDESKLTLLAKVNRTRIRVKCAPENRSLFKSFAARCGQLSGTGASSS